MKIAVIGSGKIGSTAARLSVAAGHQVAIANRRGRGSLRDLERELGGPAHATTVQDAAQFGELVLVAVPLGVIDTLPPSAFAGKVVIDANNYYPNRDGRCAGSRGLELVTSVRARNSDYQLPPWQSLAGLGPAQVRCRAPLLPLDSMNASPDREWAVIT